MLDEIKDWILSKGLLRLADVYSWDSNGNWDDWSFPEIPHHLNVQKNILLAPLTGLAPVHMSFKDKWGWGIFGSYSATKGYLELQQNSNDSCLLPAIWKSVCSPFCIPKVNFVSWLVLHNKLLTSGNLIKHGFHGPFR